MAHNVVISRLQGGWTVKEIMAITRNDMDQAIRQEALGGGFRTRAELSQQRLAGDLT